MNILKPATGERFGRVPLSTQADVDHAVSAAKKAQPAWGRLSHAERRNGEEAVGDADRSLQISVELPRISVHP